MYILRELLLCCKVSKNILDLIFVNYLNQEVILNGDHQKLLVQFMNYLTRHCCLVKMNKIKCFENKFAKCFDIYNIF
jgi:hypothetical protein